MAPAWRDRLADVWPLVVALATGVWLYVQIRPAGIWNDDVLNLQQHSARPLRELLLEPVFMTQVAPGHRLLTELQLQVGATDRVVVHALLAGLVGLIVLVGSRITRRLQDRPTWWPPLLLGLVLAGPAGLATNLWYAAAFHLVPALVFGLLAALLHLRWRGDGWRSGDAELPAGWPRAAVLVLFIGLMFSLKTILVVPFLLLLEYILLREGDLETLLVGLWKDRRVWNAYGLLVAIYWFLTQRAGIDPPIGEAAVIIEAVGRSIVTMSVPMLLGLASAQEHYLTDPLPPWLLVSSWVVVGGLALSWARRSRLAARGIVVSLTLLAASLAVSAASRTPSFGVEAALSPRYHLEGLVYAVITMSVALRTLDPPLLVPARSTLVRGTGHVVVAAALIGATVWSNGVRLDVSQAVDSGRWIADLEEGLAGRGRAPDVLDTPLPDFVIPLFPGRRLADLDGLVEGLSVAPTSADAVVGPDATVEDLRTIVLFRQTGAEYAGNALVALAGDLTLRRSDLCTTTSMTLELVLGRHPAPRYFELAIAGPATVRIDFTPRDGFPGEPPVEHVLSGDTDRLIVPLDPRGWVDRTTMTLTATEPLPACLQSVAFLEVRNELPGSAGFGDDVP